MRSPDIIAAIEPVVNAFEKLGVFVVIYMKSEHNDAKE